MKIMIISSFSHSISYLFAFVKFTDSMFIVVVCTHSTVKLLNVHIQWLLAIECVDSMAKLLNVDFQ